MIFYMRTAKNNWILRRKNHDGGMFSNKLLLKNV